MEWAGSCYFALKGATPSPLDAAALSLGSADPLPTIPPSVGADPLPSMDSPHHSVVSRRGPPSLLRTLPTIPPSVSADPLPPSARTPPHHSAVLRRGPPLFHGPPLPTAPRAPPHHSAVSRRGPPLLRGPLSLLPRTPRHHSVVRRRGPPLSGGADPPLAIAADPGCASFAAHGGGGGASGKLRSKWCLRRNFFAVQLRGWWNGGP
ncbi:hypothetical protein niasHT_028607 [Heterodera trifolii]|uniref:Uncharacterized protein n=1 Tax=Heterodera trifolii TaxID=157864 RepID=A0ABD2KAN2_9BILA